MAIMAVGAYGPKSASGGVSDNQQITLVATTSQTVVVGVRQIIGITISGATSGDTNGTVGAHIRFGLTSTPSAVATDFFLPAGQPPVYFDLGEEFDRVAFFSAGTPVVNVMRMNRAV
jgi:hypothetical protein